MNGAAYRAYSPNLGRWINEDPIALEGGINLYQYVRSNPLKYTDPLGLLDPCGGLFYGPDAYKKMKAGVKEGVKVDYPNATPEEVETAAMQITKEMRVLEAKDIAEKDKKNDIEGIRTKLKEIYEKVKKRPKAEQDKVDKKTKAEEAKCQK